MNKKKLTVIFGILFYLCVQIPVAILGFKGIHLADLLSAHYEKKNPQEEIILNPGTYDLYDYTTGKKFGVLKLEQNSEYFIGTINSENVKGKDSMLDYSYDFHTLSKTTGRFQKNTYNDGISWICDEGDKIIVIAHLEKEYNHKLPNDIRSMSGTWFFITEITKKEYDFLTSEHSSVSLKTALLNGMYQSFFSAFFRL